jgi:hypothetical protein
VAEANAIARTTGMEYSSAEIVAEVGSVPARRLGIADFQAGVKFLHAARLLVAARQEILGLFNGELVERGRPTLAHHKDLALHPRLWEVVARNPVFSAVEVIVLPVCGLWSAHRQSTRHIAWVLPRQKSANPS